MCLKPREPLADGHTALDLVCEVVDDFSAALVNARIYESNHPRVRASVDAVRSFLRWLPREDGDPLRLAASGDLLLYGDQPLLGASMTASRMIQSLEAWKSGGIEIDQDVSPEDLIQFLCAFGARPEEGADWSDLNARLEAANVRAARLLPPFVESTGIGNRSDLRTDLSTPLRFYQSCMNLLQDVTVSVCHGGYVDFGPVQTHVEAVLRQLGSGEGEVLNLARQDQYDAFTFGHSVRVGVLAMNFARSLTTDQDLLVRIGTAALLHDCGKALVPFEILHSRERLGDEERLVMSKHAQFGAEILIDHDDADPLAIASAFGHHRSTGGGGYPKTIQEHQNLLVTEIVKLCDIYEALTAARPYKRPMSPIRAYRVMIGMGDHMDRALLRRFIHVNGLYPAGQRVLLSTGEQASVIAQTDDISMPRVQLLTDRAGEVLDKSDRRSIDLRNPGSEEVRMILMPIDEREAAA